MSYDNDTLIWVGDLDDYVDIDAISREYEWERRQDALNEDLEKIGDIELIAGRKISSRTLYARGVSPDKWRWLQHDAQSSFGHIQANSEIEAAFLKELIALGRRYSTARYARMEHLSFSSAITSTFPYGIKALLYQYITGEPLLAGLTNRISIQKYFHETASQPNLTAYDRVRYLQIKLHLIANSTGSPEGYLRLNKDATKNILSLCRLYFSSTECKVKSFSELNELHMRYELARREAANERNQDRIASGKFIPKWRMRHLHSLFFFFPYSIRNSLARSIQQTGYGIGSFDRPTAVNELALARCEIEMMREKARKRSVSDE